MTDTNIKYAAQIEVRDVVQRREEISNLVKQARADNSLRPFYDFPGKTIHLPLIRIPTASLVYRMENRRTRVRQLGLIKKHGLAEGYFLKGEENDTAQRDQHQLLVDFTTRDMGGVKSISKVLQEEKKQREPLLITHEGVVVNGNRRLAAMRELCAHDAKTFEVFEYVDALVLPADVDHRTISKIEIKLQMTPDTRLSYSWVDEGLALREMRDNESMSLDELAALMKLDHPREVTAMIERVQEAENYLEDYLGRPADYEVIVDKNMGQHFKDVQAVLAGKKGKEGLEQELSRAVSYVIGGNPDSFQGRIYAYKQAFGEDVLPVLEALKVAFADEFMQAAADLAEEKVQAQDDDLDALFGPGVMDPFAEFVPLKKILLDRSKGPELAANVVDTVNELNLQKKGADREQAALRDATKANTTLAGIRLDTASPKTYQQIKAQLEGAQRRGERLLEELASRMKDTPGG